MHKIALFALFSLIAIPSMSQIVLDDPDDYTIKQRGYAGIGIGNLGLGSGPYGTYYSIGITPQVGYMINQYLSSGFAFDYQYTGYPDQKVSITQYGWYPYLRGNIKKFFVQTDYDWYSVPTGLTSSEREIVNRFLIGAGYFSQGKGRGGSNILISYDVLYDSTSLFNSPLVIRIFFTF